MDRPIRILVVDDDPLLLKALRKILSKAGYDVLTASDVEAALRQTTSGPIDAALVDYTLAYDTGQKILEHLRKVMPSCVRILITARTDLAIFVDAINHGEVARVIRKPFEAADLLRELKDALKSAEDYKNTIQERQHQANQAEGRDLDQALRGSLGMALQPIFDLKGGTPRPVAFEALLRPKHLRLNNPAALLDTAERHDRIGDVGSSVFALAGRILCRIPLDQRLFVNLHPMQLRDPEQLVRDLAQFRDQTHRVTVEITEQSALNTLDRWEESIHAITRSGCNIAVDDLGAGYSSLSILADLQPAYLKLDMTLVRSIHQKPRKQRLVSMLRSFGDATGTAVIAEGVESEGETRALVDCGVTLLQGYHLARPSERFVDLRGPPLV